MVRPPLQRALALVASLAVSIAVPERVSAAEGDAPEALAPGSWSVQFSVQPNFTLGSYSGSTLSLKRHLASGNALRFGVSVNLSSQDDDFAEVAADTTRTDNRTLDAEGHGWTFGLSTYYLWYAGRATPLHFYWGTGPTVSWSRVDDERIESQTLSFTGQPPQAYTSTFDRTGRAWQVGLAVALGAEWLVARRVGVFAEYGTALAYMSNEASIHSTLTSTAAPPRITDSKLDRHGWDFSGSGGRLGVSAYF